MVPGSDGTVIILLLTEGPACGKSQKQLPSDHLYRGMEDV